MANEIKSQLKLKAAEEFLVLYPETSADVVYTAVEGITATNVEDAIAELYGLIQAITNGGVVTGIKQPGDESYKQGNIDITPETLGLGNVNNTADEDKPVSTATQTAIEEAVVDALSEAKEYTEEYAGVVNLDITKEDAVYKYTFTFTKADGTATTTVIDLPLEEMILSCEYDKETKELIIELATGEELKIDIEDIIGGLVNQSEYDEKVAELEGRIDTINTAEGNVEEAVKAAQAAAEAAQSAADTAESHVTEVKAQAEQAQTDATQALTDAATAQSAAEAAQSTADDAQTAAETAQSAAESAQGIADEAKETAEATKTALEDTDIAGTYSAVGVNEAGVVVAGQNIVEYWEDGEEPADSNLAIGGIAIVPIKE